MCTYNIFIILFFYVSYFYNTSVCVRYQNERNVKARKKLKFYGNINQYHIRFIIIIGIDHCIDIIYLFVIVVRSNYYAVVPIQSVKHFCCCCWLFVGCLFQTTVWWTESLFYQYQSNSENWLGYTNNLFSVINVWLAHHAKNWQRTIHMELITYLHLWCARFSIFFLSCLGVLVMFFIYFLVRFKWSFFPLKCLMHWGLRCSIWRSIDNKYY